MSINIEPGQDYLLDGKTQVKVLKPVNRSLTVFNIEIPGQRVESVEANRLQHLKKNTITQKTGKGRFLSMSSRQDN